MPSITRANFSRSLSMKRVRNGTVGGVEDELDQVPDLREDGARRRKRRLADLDFAHGPLVLGQDVAHALAQRVDEIHHLRQQLADARLVAGQVAVEEVELRRDVDDEQHDRADQDEEQHQDRDDAGDARAFEERDEGAQREGEEEGEGQDGEEVPAVVEQRDHRGGREDRRAGRARGGRRACRFRRRSQKSPLRGRGLGVFRRFRFAHAPDMSVTTITARRFLARSSGVSLS